MTEKELFRAGDIVFSRNDTYKSKLVRMRTLSQWCHCGIIIGRTDGTIKTISARGDGVKVEKLREWGSHLQVLRIESATEQQIQCMLDFAIRQVGKTYGWLGWLDFWCAQKKQSGDRWFASELVTAAILSSGFDLFRSRKTPSFTTPGDLYENPLLTFVSSME